MASTYPLAPVVAAALIALVGAGKAHADPRAEVTAAFEKAMAETSYRLYIDVDNRRGPIRTQMDVQLPNRFHMRTDESEFVIVPEGTWINAAGRWMRVPVDMSKQIGGYSLEEARNAVQSDIVSIEKLGSEDVDGCTSSLYRYTATSRFAGRSSEDEIELAVCDATGKPARLRSKPKKKGDAVTIRYDFDAAIDIRPPR